MRFLILILIIFITSCSIIPKRQEQPAEVKETNIDELVNPKNLEQSVIETVPLMDDGVRSLYGQAQNYYTDGLYNQAIASLERAYDIQPDAPQVSQFLAEISLHQGRIKQAYYWADLATRNGPSKGEICGKSWRILAIAAEKLGYYAKQSKALESIESCLVKVPERY